MAETDNNPIEVLIQTKGCFSKDHFLSPFRSYVKYQGQEIELDKQLRHAISEMFKKLEAEGIISRKVAFQDDENVFKVILEFNKTKNLDSDPLFRSWWRILNEQNDTNETSVKLEEEFKRFRLFSNLERYQYLYQKREYAELSDIELDELIESGYLDLFGDDLLESGNWAYNEDETDEDDFKEQDGKEDSEDEVAVRELTVEELAEEFKKLREKMADKELNHEEISDSWEELDKDLNLSENTSKNESDSKNMSSKEEMALMEKNY